VVATWKYLCPRLTIWEDAADQGLVARETSAGFGMVVMVTEDGERLCAPMGGVPADASESRPQSLSRASFLTRLRRGRKVHAIASISRSCIDTCDTCHRYLQKPIRKGRAAMIDLHYWSTPNGHKISIFLEETGLEYKVFPVNIGKGDQFKPDFSGGGAEQPDSRVGRPCAKGRGQADLDL